jgi:hypothetical protein
VRHFWASGHAQVGREHAQLLSGTTRLRTVRRPRRYVAGHWLALLRPLLRYSASRDAYVLRGVGRYVGPVLRLDRRLKRKRAFEGAEDRRRRAGIA